MPRPASGPKLWFDKSRGTFSINDGKRKHRTRFVAGEAAEAAQALSVFINEKFAPAEDKVAINKQNPLLAILLDAYLEEKLIPKRNGEKRNNGEYHLANITRWWGTKKLSEVTEANCLAYTATKNAPGARNDLKMLRTAINHWHAYHGPLSVIPMVLLPDPSGARERFLSQPEFVRLLWAARHTPHLARFLIVGWYTGSRSINIFKLMWSMVDFDRGVVHRVAPSAKRAGNKRTPPVKAGRKFLGHLRRWKRMDSLLPLLPSAVIHFRGAGVAKLRRSWESAVAKAELTDDVTPHVLRHSRATHLMRSRVNPWEAAQSLGMTVEVLTRVYGHHNPDWQSDASEAR
jgi:integrase